jgi:hypothetical protein
VQVLRGGLIVAALIGEACQRRAVQVLGVGLHFAAIVGKRSGNDKKGGENNCDVFHFPSPQKAAMPRAKLIDRGSA